MAGAHPEAGPTEDLGPASLMVVVVVVGARDVHPGVFALLFVSLQEPILSCSLAYADPGAPTPTRRLCLCFICHWFSRRPLCSPVPLSPKPGDFLVFIKFTWEVPAIRSNCCGPLSCKAI